MRLIFKWVIFFVLILWVFEAAFAQVPHVKGTITLSVKNRTIEGDLQYSNLPPRYSILLNKFFDNPQFFDENGAPLLSLDSMSGTFEALLYKFKDSLSAPGNFRVKYNGKQKEKDRLFSEKEDWKGNIAYNGYSVRASE
ncbi:hypothetical protein BH23BAC1_BH23BAC1_19350 [soil metagenome]